MKRSSTVKSAFKTSKYGVPYESCADSFAVSADGKAFAVADGVTKSFIPKSVADALTAYYAGPGSRFAGELFAPENALDLLTDVQQKWESDVHEIESVADELTQYNLSIQRRKYGVGASTFAGIRIDDDGLRYDVLGDSCIFLIPYSRDIPPSILTSMPSAVDLTQDHPLICKFGTHPHFLDTSGRIAGKPESGSVPHFYGTILMMTDALAEWYCRHFTAQDSDQATEMLRNIGSQEDFEKLIDALRNADLKNDDVALLIVETGISFFDFDHPFGENIRGLLTAHDSDESTSAEIDDSNDSREETDLSKGNKFFNRLKRLCSKLKLPRLLS